MTPQPPRVNVRPRPAPLAGLHALWTWILRSWLRPAGAAARWEQEAGHERANSRPVAPVSRPVRGSTHGGAETQEGGGAGH